jgi:hypothetical protein
LTTGWYISGAAHIALILYLLVGGLFARERFPEMAVTEVSLVSEAEYAALVLRAPAPEVNEAIPSPDAPEPDTSAPEMPTTDAAPAVAVPEQAEAPDVPETPPEAPEIVVPDADVTTEAPVIAPPTVEDGDTVAPPSTPAPAPRVAPDPTPVPPVEAETAPQVVEQTAPEPSPEAPVEEQQEAAAPEAATTRIITEADRPDTTAPVESIRPRARPPRPVRTAEPAPETPRETPPAPQDNAVEDAVAAALAEANRPAASAAPSGPPMTDGEKDALRVAVQQCWNVGSLSTDALRTTVTVGVSMARDGRPDTGSIRMIGFEGGSEAAARQAYEAARRAIIRCGANGFALPVEKYDHWRDIEMVFNPERMRIR